MTASGTWQLCRDTERGCSVTGTRGGGGASRLPRSRGDVLWPWTQELALGATRGGRFRAGLGRILGAQEPEMVTRMISRPAHPVSGRTPGLNTSKRTKSAPQRVITADAPQAGGAPEPGLMLGGWSQVPAVPPGVSAGPQTRPGLGRGGVGSSAFPGRTRCSVTAELCGLAYFVQMGRGAPVLHSGK